MPNVSPLGGSPLNLIGVRSFYDRNGVSTFNTNKTRNINVFEYNRNSSNANMTMGNSLFSGYRVFRAWPNINVDDPKGLGDVDYAGKKDNSTRKTLHNNSVYDTSILNIIAKLAGTKGQLRPADFAYLKNVGVYPNNRLIIARRFALPSDDNIMVPKGNSEVGSLATLISWISEEEDFLKISFGEEWQDSEADFTGILNSLGEDVNIGGMGDGLGKGLNALPLPGFTEIFQRRFLEKLGLLEKGSANMIPAGNPNLIKSAKRRKLIPYSEAGSGLKCMVNIKMVCDYELKYISGIDPTLVWMDLLGMITRFGTSDSSTYGLSKQAAATLKSWASSPSALLAGVGAALKDALEGIKDEVNEFIAKYFKSEDDSRKVQEASSRDSSTSGKISGAQKIAEGLISEFKGKFLDVIDGLLQKYRVKILGVTNALAGLPSTPWHVTIGNPLRPTFCSGDMLVENVDLKLGPILAFNDLPAYITVEFNITNARPWGLQEIMSKFNSGYLRTVDVQKTYYETNKVNIGGVVYTEPIGALPLQDIPFVSVDDEKIPNKDSKGNDTEKEGSKSSTENNEENTPVTSKSDGTESGLELDKEELETDAGSK